MSAYKKIQKGTFNIGMVIASKRVYKLIVVYTIIYTVIVLALAVIFFFSDKVPFNGADSISYSVPSAIYVRRYIIDFFSGRWYLYDFAVGYGNNVIETLSWSGLGDPFSVILCFFSEDKILIAIIVSICTRLFFAGLSIILCFHRKVEDDCILFILTFSYLFSPFTIRLGLQFYTWLNALITFPMLITGIETNCTVGKRSFRLPIGVFIQSLSGFYFLYIELMFSALYAIVVCVLCEYRDDSRLKGIVKSLTKNLIGVFCGMGMGIIILGPSIQAFFSSSRSSSTNAGSWSGSLFDRLIEGIVGLIIPMRSFFGLSVPIGFLCLTCIAFFNNKARNYNKVIFVLAICSFYSLRIGSLLNGFSSPQNDRWTFVVVFFAINLVADGLPTNIVIKKKPATIIALMLFLSFWGYLYFTRNTKAFILFGIVAIFIICLLVDSGWMLHKCRILLILTLFNILMVVNLINGTLSNLLGRTSANVMESYVSYGDINTIIKNDRDIGNIADSMSRIDVTGLSRNINVALTANVKSCSQFFSMCNKSAYDFYFDYGLYGSNALSGMKYFGLDQRSILLDYFAVSKYYSYETNIIEENRDYIPWGILYDKVIDETYVRKLNAIERMQLLCECAVVDTRSINKENYEFFEIHKTNGIDTIDFKVKKNNDEFLTRTINIDKNENIIIYPEYSPSSDYETYLTVKENKYKGDFRPFLNIEGVTVPINGEYGYKDKNGQQLIKRIVPHNEAIVVTNLGHNEGIEQQSELAGLQLVTININKNINKLHGLKHFKNVLIRKDQVSGEIEGKGILVLPIFYDKGWKCYIDGKETRVFKANSGLIAVELDEGNHEVEFFYKSYSTAVFTIISVFFVIFVTCYYAYDTRCNRRI